jgi:ATP-binding cassette subfamily C protein
VAVVVMAASTIAARGVLVSRLRFAFVDDLRSRLHAALIAARWQVARRHKSADVMHVLGVEVARTGEGVHFMLRMIGWGLELPVVLAVALALSPPLTGLALICAAVIGALGIPINRMTHRIARRLGPAGRGVLNAVGEDFSALSAIKVFFRRTSPQGSLS